MKKLIYFIPFLILLHACAELWESSEQEQRRESFSFLQEKDKELFGGKTFKVGNTYQTAGELNDIMTKEGYNYTIFNGGINASFVSKVLDLMNKNKNHYVFIFPNTFTIFQNVPNQGVLVRVKAYDYYDEDFMFLIYGIQGVDKDYIRQPLALKYAGTYSYTTAMGSVKTIHSFKPDLIFNNKEYTEATIDWTGYTLAFKELYNISYYDYQKQVEENKQR